MMRREKRQSDAVLGLTTYESGRGLIQFKLDREVRQGYIYFSQKHSQRKHGKGDWTDKITASP